jgi:hypothetical protein
MSSIIPPANPTSEIISFCTEHVNLMSFISRIAYSPGDILRRVPVARHSLLRYSEFRFELVFGVRLS